MTDYTAWLNTLPPGTSSTATGSRNDGLQFSVSSACTLTGIAFYVPSAETTLTGSSYTATLYSTTNGTTGTQIAQANGSGTFTAGAWNWIAFSQALSTGVTYVASIHSPDAIQFESSYWSTTLHGVTNGPLTIPTFNAAVGNAQQPLLTGATAFPSSHNSPGTWYGVDVKVTTSGVSGSGSVNLKKMVLSAASTEKAVVTGIVNLKKMSVAGTGRAGPYSFFGPNGDGNHGSSSSLGLTGGWIAGLLFMVTEDNYELSGYSQWCGDSFQASSTIKFALWQATGGNTGTLVASSEATLGTQTPGAWASVSLGTPIALTKNQVYKVVAGTTSNLPWDNNQFGSAGPYINGSVNGPLTLFSSNSGDSGTNYDTYGDGQASYQWTNPGPTDPASQYPGSLFSASNTWTDVIVQLTSTPAISGTISLKKMSVSGFGGPSQNLFGDSVSGTLGEDSGTYTIGMQFSVTRDAPLSGIRFYSGTGSTALPGACCVFDVETETIVEGTENDSPTWDGAAESGWVKCGYDGSVTLLADHDYKVAIFKGADCLLWSELDYWFSGDGAAGQINGIIVAPKDADVPGGQDSYVPGGPPLAWPSSSFRAQNYWVDVEVLVPASPSISGTISLKKMKVSASSAEKSVVTSVIKLKKMVVAITSGASTLTLFNGDAHGLTGSGDEGGYTLGIQFSVSEDTELLGMEWYSAATSGALPATIALYEVSGHTLVHSETPTWSGAAGSGFVSAEFSSPPTLSADTDYVGVVWYGGGNSWYSEVAGYWTSGAGASGITNGILSAPSNADSAAGQALYQSGSLAYPTTTTSGYDFGVDVKVMAVALTSSASGTIKLKKMVLSGANAEKAVGTGVIKLKKMVLSGGPRVIVTFISTSSGVDTYTTVSPLNGDSATMHMRVLAPASPNLGYPHAFLWLLPVEGDQGTTFGDSIQTVKDLSANDNYNLTCIQPGFDNSPWYGDNVDDPHQQDETFLMQLVAWADAHLSTTGTEKHYLIGFSKSGFGSQAIFWRHQPKFSAVASWDTACDLQLMTDYGGDPDSSFGEQSQLDLSKLYDPNLTTWKAEGDTGTVNRIYLAAGIDLITPTSDYSDRLTADGIQHSYTYVLADSHQWAPNPGWVGPALAAMLGSPAISGSGIIKLKKMVLSGVSHEKSVATGTVKLKKMRLSGSSHEKTVVTGTIQLKKMRIHGSNEIDQHRVSPSFFVFSPL